MSSWKLHCRSPHLLISPVLALAVIIPAPAMHAQADDAATAKDVLVFTNGDQLSGTLQRSAGGTIVFKSDMAGELTVPLDKVKELRTAGAFAVLKHGTPVEESRKVVPGTIVLTDNEVSVTDAAGGTSATVPVKDVAYVVDATTFNRELAHEPALWDGWNGTVNLGTTFAQSTIHGGTVTGGAALSRQVPTVPYLRARNKTLINFQENYGVLTTPGFIAGTTTDVEAKTSILHADAERDEYVRKNMYLFGISSFDHNYSQSLDLQQLYGAGVGYTAFSTAVHQLDVKVDAHYERQHFFNNVGNQNLIGSDFSENYRRVLPLKITVTQTAAFLPAWNNLNAYAANGGVTLIAPVFRRVGLNLTATDSYINNAVAGYQKNSLTFSTGLTYTLR